MFTKSIPWSVSGAVLVISFLGWGQGLSWQISNASLYSLFPLFGLVAFSVMWAHYAVDFIDRFVKIKITDAYLNVTRFIVLFALLMHPGLLAFAQWRVGAGWPPLSWLHFVEPGLVWAVIVGIVAWLSFLAFELHWWFRQKPWFKWIVLANSLAMIAVVVHVLFVAAPYGWFLYYWYFLGVSMLIFLFKEWYNGILIKLDTN